jgi:hypothetical protein
MNASHETHKDPRRTEEERGSNASVQPEPSEQEVADAHTRERPPIFLCVNQKSSYQNATDGFVLFGGLVRSLMNKCYPCLNRPSRHYVSGFTAIETAPHRGHSLAN